MKSRDYERIRQEERERNIKKKADSFWNSFQMTEKGKVKSTLLLYSFCVAFVYGAVYVMCYGLFVMNLHPLLAGLPPVLVNLVEALIPTVVGTALCSLTWPVSQEKRTMPAAYLWLALLCAAMLITMLILLREDSQAQLLFLQFFCMFVPAPLAAGGGLSVFLYRRYLKRKRLRMARVSKG